MIDWAADWSVRGGGQSRPQCRTAAMSETQVKGGTMTSPPPYSYFRAAIVSKLADEPEFTKTLNFTPSQ